jgi:hypothetical protein
MIVNCTIVLLAENLLPPVLSKKQLRKEADHGNATFSQVSSLATKVQVRKIEAVLETRNCGIVHGT